VSDSKKYKPKSKKKRKVVKKTPITKKDEDQLKIQQKLDSSKKDIT
jgi:hypothetical protein